MGFGEKFKQIFKRKESTLDEKQEKKMKDDEEEKSYSLKHRLFSPPLELNPEEKAKMIDSLAARIKQSGMEGMAIMFLDMGKPLSFIVGQWGLAFIAPFAEIIGIRGYNWATLFSNSKDVEQLIKKLEENLEK